MKMAKLFNWLGINNGAVELFSFVDPLSLSLMSCGRSRLPSEIRIKLPSLLTDAEMAGWSSWHNSHWTTPAVTSRWRPVPGRLSASRLKKYFLLFMCIYLPTKICFSAILPYSIFSRGSCNRAVQHKGKLHIQPSHGYYQKWPFSRCPMAGIRHRPGRPLSRSK